MRVVCLLVAIVVLSGCEFDTYHDPRLRAERFDACMRNLPAGPQQTKYNDWAEVVRACEKAAYFQSKVSRKGNE